MGAVAAAAAAVTAAAVAAVAAAAAADTRLRLFTASIARARFMSLLTL